MNKIQIYTLFFPNLPWRIIWQYCKSFQIFTLRIFHNDVIFSLLPIEHIYIRGIGWCHHWRKSIWAHIAHACILGSHVLNLVWRMMNIFQFFHLQDKLNKELKYLIQNETWKWSRKLKTFELHYTKVVTSNFDSNMKIPFVWFPS